jgi:hypothetical protein
MTATMLTLVAGVLMRGRTILRQQADIRLPACNGTAAKKLVQGNNRQALDGACEPRGRCRSAAALLVRNSAKM